MNPRQIAEDIVRILVAGIHPLPDTITQMEEARQGGDFLLALGLAIRHLNAAKKALQLTWSSGGEYGALLRGLLKFVTAPIPKQGQEQEFRNAAEEAKISSPRVHEPSPVQAAHTGEWRRLWLKGVLTTLSATEWTRNVSTKKANTFAEKLGDGMHTDSLLRNAIIYPNLDWRIRGMDDAATRARFAMPDSRDKGRASWRYLCSR